MHESGGVEFIPLRKNSLEYYKVLMKVEPDLIHRVSSVQRCAHELRLRLSALVWLTQTVSVPQGTERVAV